MSVLSSLKRLIKHSAVYGLGHIVNRSIGFLLLPLYTNVFSAEAFGIVGLMVTYLTISTLIYCYGLDAGFMRHYVLADSPNQRRTIFTSAFVALFVSSLVFSGLMAFFAVPLSALLFSIDSFNLGIHLPLLIQLLAAILFCDTVAFLPLLVLRAEERSWLFISIKTFNGVVNLAANILFIVVWKKGVEGVFYANLVSSAAMLFLTVPVILQRGRSAFSWSCFLEQFLFGLPFLLSGFAIAVMDSVDRIFLERLQSVQMAGLYNAGAKLGMIMGLFVAAFRFAWHPFFLATSKQADAKQVFRKLFSLLMLAAASLLFFVTLFIEDLLRVRFFGYTLFGSTFWQSAGIVPVIMLAYIFYAAYLVFEATLYLNKKSLLIAYMTVIGMVGNVLANFLLIPDLGMFGAAWARVVGYALMAAGLYYFSQRDYPIPYEWSRLLRLAVVTIALVFISGSRAWGWPAQIGLALLFLVGLLISGFFTIRELQKSKQIVRQYWSMIFNQEKG